MSAWERRHEAWKARRVWTVTDGGRWVASASEMHSAISMLHAALRPFVAAWQLGPCAIVDEELATYTAMVARLPNGGDAARMGLEMRADLEEPKQLPSGEADARQWALDWQRYRALIDLAERASVERHHLLTDEERAAWMRAAS